MWRFELTVVLQATKLSRWYGNILGISEITAEMRQGICGLLGPNGAGKSTFLKIAAGQMKANLGKIEIFGEPIYNNHRLYRRIGFCPEYDSFYQQVSAWEFLLFTARSRGIAKKMASEMVQLALERVGLYDKRQRKIQSYSLGMRQRLKFAATIVHEPDLLILDEPLRGVDPWWRVQIIRLIKEFAAAGKSVLVSSHILPEIEAMTNNIILIHQGKVFAHGDIQEIRSLLDKHPHQISVICDRPRSLAQQLIAAPFILNIEFFDNEKQVIFKTDNRDRFFTSMLASIVEHEIEVAEITSPDDNLQAVFTYLIGRET